MSMILPKGHLSCLSSAFRYTPAVQTNIASTFARIRRELTEKIGAHGAAPQGRTELVPVVRSRRFSIEAFEAAWRMLRAGGLRPMTRPCHSIDLSDA
jgi:hypothetical protein